MGGFEMHQFRTLDRQLTRKEMTEIDSWSSRHTSNANGIDYVYHYGSFGKNEEQVVIGYFDAMLYFDGYGTRRLMFRLPAAAVNYKDLAQYRCGVYERCIEVKKKGDYVLINMYWSDDEGGDWMDEGDFPISKYTPLRREILEGDYRSLFLMWLAAKQYAVEMESDEGYDDEDEFGASTFPPVPANLQKLTAPQRNLVDFFAIDKDLIKAAVKYSPSAVSKSIDYPAVIRQLSATEKDQFLHDFLLEKPQVVAQLRQRLRQLDNEIPASTGKLPAWETLIG